MWRLSLVTLCHTRVIVRIMFMRAQRQSPVAIHHQVLLRRRLYILSSYCPQRICVQMSLRRVRERIGAGHHQRKALNPKKKIVRHEK